MSFVIENIGTIIAALVVFGVVALIVLSYVRKKLHGQPTCSCGCSDCPMKGKCHK